MPTLLRTAAQNDAYLKWVDELLILSIECADSDMLDEACRLLEQASHYLLETLMPSRSWATCINRVAIWSFDNKYSEEECWERMRFHKSQIPELLVELQLTRSSEADGVWRAHAKSGGTHCRYEPMELLVIFLTRLSTQGTWSGLVRFLGGRSRTAYVKGFYVVLNYIYLRFRDRVNDITRWAAHADSFAGAIRDEGVFSLLKMSTTCTFAWCCLPAMLLMCDAVACDCLRRCTGSILHWIY